MECRLLNLCKPHPTVFRKLLVIFLVFLPVLAVQNNNGQGHDHPLLQCTTAVSRCLFSYDWKIPESPYSPQKHIMNALPEDSRDFINELRASYGNITERLDGLSQPHTELLQHIKHLTETLKNCQNLSENRKLWDLTTDVETLKKELKHLTAAQKGTEELMLSQMQLNECKGNLTALQLDSKQLSECTEAVENSKTDMKGLQLLVRERFTEHDVVTAVRQNDLNKLRLLLDAGLRVDSRDKNRYNNTALHVACLGGHLEMIGFLVKRGAPLEARNSDNNTPLIDAVVGNHLPAVQLMIELGANPLAEGWHGETPRKRAVRNGHVKVAKWLEENGW